MVDPRRIARAQLWWSAKVLPLVSAAALSALAGRSVSPDVGAIALLLVSAAGLGAYANIVNDWADIGTDQAAGKPNLVAALHPSVRGLALIGALALGLAPWVATTTSPAQRAMLAALVVLPLAYSTPPVRLKARATAGVLADAFNVHLVPVAFAMVLLADPTERGATWWVAFLSAIVWSFGLGVRSILVHQLADEPYDRATRVTTYVIRHGPVRAVVVGRRAFGIEVVGLAALWCTVTWLAPLTGALLAAYLLLWVLNLKWDARPFDPTPRRPDAWMPLAEFYEVWPALALGATLVARDGGWWPVPVAIVVLFTGAVSKQAVDLWHLVVPVAKEVWELRHGVGRAAWDLRREGGRGVWRARVWMRARAHTVAWKIRDIPWRLRVTWYDGWIGRVRYGTKDAVMRVVLFVRRQGRRFRRIVLRRPPTTGAA